MHNLENNSKLYSFSLLFYMFMILTLPKGKFGKELIHLIFGSIN